MNNLLAADLTDSTSQPESNTTIIGVTIPTLASRLDALLLVLKTCKGDTCRNPWKALQLDGKITSLVDALDPSYDNFFENELPRVSFSACEAGYIINSEMPLFEDLQLSRRRGEMMLNGADLDGRR